MFFQNPNEDTEWNDVLRQKGIIPQKEKEISENDIINMLEQTIEQKHNSKSFLFDILKDICAKNVVFMFFR